MTAEQQRYHEAVSRGASAEEIKRLRDAMVKADLLKKLQEQSKKV